MRYIFFYPLLLCAFALKSPLWGEKPHLVIEPSGELFADRKISIKAKGLSPGQRIEIRASQDDAFGKCWSSFALFYASEEGIVDTAAQKPLDASCYQEIDGGGLLWSMKEDIDHKNSVYRAPSSHIQTDFSLYVEGKLQDSISCKRLLQDPSVVEIDPSEEGLVGTMYIPKHSSPSPLIIIVSSSSGEVPKAKAKLLAARGFATFALGYFGKGQARKKLKEIPLEYFDRAITWAKKQKGVDPSLTALLGTSRGGELCLILGSFFPQEFTAIVAVVPSSIAYASLTPFPAAAWMYKGKPALPYLPMPKPNLLRAEGLTKKRPACMRKAFIHSLTKHSKNVQKASIPVEKIRCPLLLISSGDDQMWPSELFCTQIVDRIHKLNGSACVTHHHFPYAGHGIALPFLPASEPTYLHPAVGLWFATGGTKRTNAEASALSWDYIVSFLQKAMPAQSVDNK